MYKLFSNKFKRKNVETAKRKTSYLLISSSNQILNYENDIQNLLSIKEAILCISNVMFSKPKRHSTTLFPFHDLYHH